MPAGGRDQAALPQFLVRLRDGGRADVQLGGERADGGQGVAGARSPVRMPDSTLAEIAAEVEPVT
ncbi:hypothetical protein V2I01_23730 [Micromonospora sp. BRA006-A]|nr:hypothetical protein [Micromonospora sp. BRA006-A]